MCLFQLFSDFADTLDLSECKLAIIHCAGHYDPTLVEALWQDIIDKGERNGQKSNLLYISLPFIFALFPLRSK